MNKPRVILHIGTPKSGTSGLQSLLWVNRDALRQQELLYPGQHEADHFRAVVDLRNDGYVDVLDGEFVGAWGRLVEEARHFAGTTIISHELLGDRQDDDITRILSDLSFADVHVLITARDLARQLPASWLEDLKNRHSPTFAEWLADVRERTAARHAMMFWQRQDVPRLVDRWSYRVGTDHVHVVTVPPPGGSDDVLWQRVASVLGVVPRGEQRRGIANRSLGAVEAELLRRLNARADYRIDWPTYSTRVTWYLAGFVLPERSGRVPVTLPPDELGWVAERARQDIDLLRDSGVDVVGDLADLATVTPSGPAAAEPLEDDLVLDAALDALVALLAEDPRWTAMRPLPEPSEP